MLKMAIEMKVAKCVYMHTDLMCTLAHMHTQRLILRLKIISHLDNSWGFYQRDILNFKWMHYVLLLLFLCCCSSAPNDYSSVLGGRIPMIVSFGTHFVNCSGLKQSKIMLYKYMLLLVKR